MSPTERPDPSPSLTFSYWMSGYNCFRDSCDQKFESQRAWSQHIRRKHNDNPGTSHLTQLVSDHQDRKRKQAEQDEAQRVAKRQELEAQQEQIPPTEPVVRPPHLLWATVLSDRSKRSHYSNSLSTQPYSDLNGPGDFQSASPTLCLQQIPLHHC